MSMNSTPAQGSIFSLQYQQPSHFHADHLQLFTQLNTASDTPVQFHRQLKEPLAFREALACLFATVSSDYRYVPKDRSAYLAFMQLRRSNQNQGLRRAYRAYYDWLFRNDPLAWLILDPIISVHPDSVLLEVFSKDEGCYAALSLNHEVFSPLTADSDATDTLHYGTTHIDFSPELAHSIEQIRSFRPAQFSVGQQAVSLNVETASALPNAEVIEKRINVSHSWLRGFLQVQSATQLPTVVFYLKPLDIYKALRHLRLTADSKGKRRGLRIELVPKQAPRLVLEPDDTVIEGSAEPYQGKTAQIIRLWGRRRLALLSRFLPYTHHIEVRLLGNGMPSFWILRGERMTFSLALTGFSASNWAQSLNFDLLLPRRAETVTQLADLVNALKKRYSADLATLMADTQLSKPQCLAALQQASQQGLVIYDLAQAVYRYRPLTDQPLEMAQFQYRHPAEQLAYDLVARQKAIGTLSLNILPQEGTEISATIKVKEDQREYLSQLKISEEGQISKASCSCAQIMQHGLSYGPCSHLIALRLAYAEQQTNRDLSSVTQETRFFMRRKAQQAEQIQITLNEKRLLIQRQQQHKNKQQQFAFNSIAEARQAYATQLAQLLASGFIES